MTRSALNVPYRQRGTAFVLAMSGLVVALCPTTALRAQAPGWNFRTNIGPAPRYNLAMCNDSVRGQSIIFGGFGPNPPDDHFGDTWEWDGTNWSFKTESGPEHRYGPALAYDSAREVTVEFGGHMHDIGQVGDTWEWDGTTWTQRSDSGPTPRDGHAIAYDAARGRTVLFGGHDNSGTYRDDTWEWNGTSWTQVGIGGAAPPGRWLHAMAYDSARQRTVMFGGNNGSVDQGDTWEWDGTAWALKSTSGPSARQSPALAYDSTTKRTVLFGGAGPADTWEWDGSLWTRRSVSGPSQRIGPVMAYDTARDRVVMFGGTLGGGFFGDTWEYRGVRLGDMNVDGKVDGLDVEPFVAAMLTQPTNATNVYIGDFNGNGVLDVGDVGGFVAALLSGQ